MARIFPNSYAAARVQTHVSFVELHSDPLNDALPTELPRPSPIGHRFINLIQFETWNLYIHLDELGW